MGKASRRKREHRQGPVLEVSGDMMEILEHGFREREAKLGRPLGPGDPLFPGPFDSAAYRRSMVAGLLRVGARSDVIAAFEKTARVVLPRNRANLDAAAVAEWDDALAAYHAEHPDEEPTDLHALQEAFDTELHRTAIEHRPQ